MSGWMGVMFGGQGGCERRKKVIVKIQNKNSGDGVGWSGQGGGESGWI